MKWFYRGAYTLHGRVNLDCCSKIAQNCACEELSATAPINFFVRWACKRNRENSHLTAYQRHCFANHRMMICVLFTVVFFTVCTTIDWEVRILERPLSRTTKNELRFFAFVRSFVPTAVPDPERMNARTEGFEIPLQLHRREQNINTHISPAPFSTADVQIANRLQMVAFCVLAELVCKALW